MFGQWRKGYRYENTRQYPRLPASWPVKFEPRTADNGLFVGATRDVGAGGVALTVQEMLPVGTRLRMEVLIPVLNRSIQAEGQVIRCLPTRGGFDIGIRFLDIAPQDRSWLNEAIEQSQPNHGQEDPKRTWWRKL